jgi:hypothetical protein
LMSLILDLKQSRLATVHKVREEKEQRQTRNRAAVEIIREFQNLWGDVHGPDLVQMEYPTDKVVEQAKRAGERLKERSEAGTLRRHPSVSVLKEEDQLATVALLCEASQSVQSVEWEVIRRERFMPTSDAIWQELVKSAEDNVQRAKAREWRQRAAESTRLAAQDSVSDAEDENCEWVPDEDCQSLGEDPNCDPDEFKRLLSRKPYNWKHAVRAAEMVHVASMRFLLEALRLSNKSINTFRLLHCVVLVCESLSALLGEL